METMTIKYNPANTLVQPVIELIQRIKDFEIVSISEDEYIPNAETLTAMKEAREGKTTRAKNSKDLFIQILGKSYV